jgi:hypothetical protein
MGLPKINFPEPQPDPAFGKGKTAWNSVLTSTPVVLTVVATVLAGLSSSEMTLAQYHRALAAQNQSKAGDQWNFFQAKRIRGTNLETTIDLLQAISDRSKVEPASVRAVSEQLSHAFQRAEEHADRLAKVVGLSTDGKLSQAISHLLDVTRTVVKEAASVGDRMKAELAHPDAGRAFAFLGGTDLPPVQLIVIDHPQIQEATRAIQQRQSEQETAAVVTLIPTEALRQSIQSAEANVQAVEDADKPVGDRLDRLDKLLAEQVGLARGFHRAVAEVNGALSDLSEAEDRPASEVRWTAATLAKSAAAVKAAAEGLSKDLKAARYGYTARRYEREAHCNQQAAALYEVQVRKSSLTSERHRGRSKHFFYGMLAAQAGVTIASFSLALKHKSLMWSLASLAGLGAVLFALYVYLYM